MQVYWEQWGRGACTRGRAGREKGGRKGRKGDSALTR